VSVSRLGWYGNTSNQTFKDLMMHIEQLDNHYYCPLKSNRQVDDSNAQKPYQRVDSLQWSETELRHGETD
jgi:hypothetical protein